MLAPVFASMEPMPYAAAPFSVVKEPATITREESGLSTIAHTYPPSTGGAQAVTVADESRFANERAVPRFREAFREYGLPAGEGAPEAAAERIRQRPAAIREAILAALNEWDALAGDPKLHITGILITRFDARTVNAREVMARL